MKFYRVAAVVVFLGIGLLSRPAEAASAPSAVYRPDIRFPQFAPLWREGWNWRDENGQKVQYGYKGMPLGGYLFAYFSNEGEQPLEVTDFQIDGVSVAKALAFDTDKKVTGQDVAIASLQFSKLPADQIERLVAAGEPVWWKVEPTLIPPGGRAELTVRLRRDPKPETLKLALPNGKGGTIETILRVREPQARFFSVNFSPKLDRVHAYLRHPSGKGVAPSRVSLDGRDITSRCRLAADPTIDTVSVVADLDAPVTEGRYYFFRAEYADGGWAETSIGAWYLGTVYGAWGSHNRGDTPEQIARNWLGDMADHNINVHMLHSSGPGHEYMHGPDGPALLKELGLRKMLHWTNPKYDPIFYFLVDEPDAADFLSTMLDPYKRIGSRGQYLVERCKLFRRHDPQIRPILLNVDNTFKPENWYTYAQLSDIPCADPYFQEGVQSVLHSDPGNMGAYIKPTYVYAVGTIYQSAGAPDPMHLILHTCRFDFKPEESPYRAPTPQEKRIEVYYALAAGAKQISFWWYTPGERYYGLGGLDPEMRALWKEVGLLGAEMRTLGPVLERSCPANVPVEAPPWLWTRCLIADDDTLVVLAVNDNNFSDRLGTVIRPIENASMQVALPGWLKPAEVFELTWKGTADVTSVPGPDKVKIDLGTVDVTRLVVITKEPGLRSRLQRVYETQFQANVRKILAAE